MVKKLHKELEHHLQLLELPTNPFRHIFRHKARNMLLKKVKLAMNLVSAQNHILLFRQTYIQKHGKNLRSLHRKRKSEIPSKSGVFFPIVFQYLRKHQSITTEPKPGIQLSFLGICFIMKNSDLLQGPC